MNPNEKTSQVEPQPEVRSSRYLGLAQALALGVSVILALGVFILLGIVLEVSGSRAPFAYGLTALILIPIFLAFVERALAFPNGMGVFNIGRSDEPTIYVFGGYWLAFGGLVVLVSLLGWGAAFHLNTLIYQFFSLKLDNIYLAEIIIVLTILLRAITRSSTWQSRARFVYIGILGLVIVVFLAWISQESQLLPQQVVRPPGDILMGLTILGGMTWSVFMIIGNRGWLRNQNKILPTSIFITLISGCLIGLIAAIIVLASPIILQNKQLPLAAFIGADGGWLEVAYLLLGAFICLIAIERALVSSQGLLGSMMQSGFFPPEIKLLKPIPVSKLFVIGLLSVTGVIFTSVVDAAYIAALAIYLITGTIFSVDLFRPTRQLPKNRIFHLPFYPLFPAIAIAISLYLSFHVGSTYWFVAAGWIITGAILYLIYARKNGTEIRRVSNIVALEMPVQAEKSYKILIDITETDDPSSLLHLGTKLACEANGMVIVAKIFLQPANIPFEMAKQQAVNEISAIKDIIQEVGCESVPVETMVRIAPSRSSGVLETVREESIDLVLVSWKSSTRFGRETLDSQLFQVVNKAPCDVGLLFGEVHGDLCSVFVSTRGGPHAGEALKYGHWLTGEGGEKVTALNVIRGPLTPEIVDSAQSKLNQAISDAGDIEKFNTRIGQASNVKEGILRETQGADLLLMGASTRGLLDEAVFEGIPVEVALGRSGPTLLVKHYEGARQFWLRRLWQMIYSPLPTLTVSERSEVIKGARRSAQAGVDFYALIILAAVIALLGLMQNSAAVIIGAMLVAPLMSPILSMALSLVLGDINLLSQSGDSTIKGVFMAVAVAVGIAVLLPSQPITGEILSRTQPNLLDLLVALASGAAAAYAIARKQVAAALPGVAIAAALVPPLSVVGYGLGCGLYSLAGGALLLFLTNLSAIVLSAAIVFLLLGFRPLRAEYGQRIQRWILLTIGILFIIAIPLVATTINLQNRFNRQSKVENVLSSIIDSEFAEVEDLVIQPTDQGYLISGTVYTYGDVTQEELLHAQQELSDAINAPVIFRARIIQSRLEIIGETDQFSFPTNGENQNVLSP